MCAISGLVLPRGAAATTEHVRIMARLVDEGSERGRDSWGVVTASGRRVTGLSQYKGGLTFDGEDTGRWMMANNRAEPTTEWVERKLPADVQPFSHSGVTVAHNGTIANDKALAATYGVEPTSRVDSAVLPPIIARLGLTDVARFMSEEVVGSYAVAAGDDNDIVLVCNYRPLYLSRQAGAMCFSSSPDHLVPAHERADVPVMRVPPYSCVTFKDDATPVVTPLPREQDERVLVVASGGLDSTVVAAHYATAGVPTTLLHFHYGARAEGPETKAVTEVAEALGVDVMFVRMDDLFRNVIGGSPLTNSSDSIAEGEAGAEYAFEWVPARNLIMLSVATGIAEAHGFSTLALGNNIEEAGAYPDNEQEFIRLLNDVMPYAVADGKHVRIEMPVGSMVKHEIVEYGHEIGAPIAESWSCYNAGDVHCGECGPCYMRRRAHIMHMIPDPTEYAQ